MYSRKPFRFHSLLFIAAWLVGSHGFADDKARVGSLDFAFDGGSLECSFGTATRGETPSVARILHPASVEAWSKRAGIPGKRDGKASVVLVSDAEGRFVPLTRKSVIAWSKSRIAQMSGRSTSVGENAFVAAVVHTLTSDVPVTLWGPDAQSALEAGQWCKLFDSKLAEAAASPGGDPFSIDPPE